MCIRDRPQTGRPARVTTFLGDEVEGDIYCYDKKTDCVVLQELSSHPTQRKSYRIIKFGTIKEITYLGDTTSNLRPVVNVDMQKVLHKEQVAIAEAHKEAARVGVGVSLEAQRIFNAMSKTLPCKWDKEDIIVFDDVRIAKPYEVISVSGGAQSSENELKRVKMVLEREKQKLKNLGKI
eukprot:TRINITY_DN315_c0_g1_i6.p1 TRINITY_DN315_c0_g1~~TRINITY_DN315_c0_g1_i6.p1  ORF type:complete len:179 (-),score=27.33 TRINITY_DN315_c0_g1_i6:130-666(-)